METRLYGKLGEKKLLYDYERWYGALIVEGMGWRAGRALLVVLSSSDESSSDESHGMKARHGIVNYWR